MADGADRFGELLVRGLRSHALGLFGDLANGRLIASCWRPYQDAIAALSEEQRWQVRDVVAECVDCGLDQFLQAIRHSGVSFVVEGQEVGKSDLDLVERMFGKGGWISRFGDRPALGEDDNA